MLVRGKCIGFVVKKEIGPAGTNCVPLDKSLSLSLYLLMGIIEIIILETVPRMK